MQNTSKHKHSVHAARFEGVLTERYDFAGHLPVTLPPHSHDEYQVGLALTDAGEYRYRRNRYTVPIGSVSVIHPGEIHGVCGLGIRNHTSVFIQFYFPIALVRRTCEEASGRSLQSEPHLPNPILLDVAIESRLQRLHSVIMNPQSFLLQRGALLYEVILSLFCSRVAERDSSARHNGRGDGQLAVQKAREYLDASCEKEISYERLAKVCGLSPYHLSRNFTASVGLPPHRYQMLRRIERAKALLLAGTPVAQVAALLGFAQQSHFGDVFRRFVGVSPGHYRVAESRNLIDRR